MGLGKPMPVLAIKKVAGKSKGTRSREVRSAGLHPSLRELLEKAIKAQNENTGDKPVISIIRKGD